MSDPLQCTVCGTKFPTRDELVDHVVDTHQSLINQRDKEDPTEEQTIEELRRVLKEHDHMWTDVGEQETSNSVAAAIEQALKRLHEDE